MNQDDLDDQAREELEYALVGVGESLGFDSRAFATSTSTTAQYEAPGAGYHIFHRCHRSAKNLRWQAIWTGNASALLGMVVKVIIRK